MEVHQSKAQEEFMGMIQLMFQPCLHALIHVQEKIIREDHWMIVADEGTRQTTGTVKRGTGLIPDLQYVATSVSESANITGGYNAALWVIPKVECIYPSSISSQHGASSR
jgi:hypothetical protein